MRKGGGPAQFFFTFSFLVNNKSLFPQNSNNLNFKLFVRLYTWSTTQVFCLKLRRILDNESFWMSIHWYRWSVYLRWMLENRCYIHLRWSCVILNSLIVHVNWLPMINHQTTSAKFSPSSLPYSIPCLIIWRSLFLFLKYWNNFGDKSRVQNLWVISEIGDYFHLLSNGVQTFYTRNVGMMSHKRRKSRVENENRHNPNIAPPRRFIYDF